MINSTHLKFKNNDVTLYDKINKNCYEVKVKDSQADRFFFFCMLYLSAIFII